MKISCILFDLDNTLIEIPNTWKYFDNLIGITLKESFNLPVPCMEERNTLWRTGKDYVKKLKKWGIDNPDEFWREFDQFDAKNRRILIKNNELILYDDVISTLSKLKERKYIKLGIVTNTPYFLAVEELKAFDLIDYFDEVIGLGDDQSICKPEPEGIHLILEKLHCKPEETIFIGDSSNDILAGLNAGVFPILIDHNNRKHFRGNRINPEQYKKISKLNQLFDFL